MVNVVRSGGGEADEQTELNDDEDQGENNAGESDREADAIVEEVASSEQCHKSSEGPAGGIQNSHK
jgi:hypothetical protein